MLSARHIINDDINNHPSAAPPQAEARAAETPPVTAQPDKTAQAGQEAQRLLLIAALVSAALAAIGSVGTWVVAIGGLARISGTDGDGTITLIAALLAASVLLFQLLRPSNLVAATGIAALCGAVVLGVFVYDGRSIFGMQAAPSNEFFGGVDLASPGWGIWLLGAAACGLLLCSLLVLVKHFDSKAGDANESTLPSGTATSGVFYSVAVLAVAVFFATAAGALPSSPASSEDEAASTADLENAGGSEEEATYDESEAPADVGEDDYSQESEELSGYNYTVGQSEVLRIPDQYSVAVTEFESPKKLVDSGGTFDSVSPRGKWVVVKLRIRNDTGANATLWADDVVKLVDTDGTVYTSSAGKGDEQIGPLDNYITGRELQPKLWERGSVAFDVPESAAIGQVQFAESLEEAFDDTPVSTVDLDEPVV